MADPPFNVNFDLRGIKLELPADPSLLIEPNYSVFRQSIDQRFDGTVERHDSILAYNALTQSVDKVFQDNVKRALALPDREAQISALMEYTDKPLAPRHIVQIAQELSLRSASNDVITFLDAQQLVAKENGTTAFFQSPEVMQWRATELQRAGRQEDAARLGAQILENADNAHNPEALRTIAMAQVAQTTGGGRAGALKAFEEGFAKTGDYSLGMGALNAALETGNIAQAKQIAPLVMLAAKNVGADQSKSFWPAVVNAQAAIVSGDELESARALRQLSSVLNAKNENGTPVASDADRAAALRRIGDIVEAQGGELETLLKPLAEQLRGNAPATPLSAAPDPDETFRRRGYTSRQAMTPEGFHVRGNVRKGGMLPDSSTTLRDKMQFLEVAKTPLEKLVQTGVIAAADLPPGTDLTKSLYDIADVPTRIQASQTVARGIFDVDGRNLEDLHGIDHKIYDSVVRLRITHAGATSVGHFEGDEYAAYQKIQSDKTLAAAIRNNEVTPDQLRVLADLQIIDEPGVSAVTTAQRLLNRGDVLLATDTRTNLAVAASEGIGDCRHVAAATEALVSAVQQDKTAGLIRQAAESLNSGDAEGYNRLTQAANAEINGYEMRIYDQEVRAAVEVPEKYNPLLTKDGKFVAALDSKPQTIETHMHNVVRMEGADGAGRYVVADSFYQKGPYRMGWVENSAPEVFDVKGTDLLRLSGGEIEAVVCERDANGKVILDAEGHPVPVLGADGKPKTVRTPIVLESTKYSSPERLEVGTPGPENRLNGTTLDAGSPDLTARLLDPERRANYISQAEFIVRNPAKVDTPELAQPEVMQQAEARVMAQATELRGPRDVMERYNAGSATVETYSTSGAEMKDGVLKPNPGQADGYAVVTTKTPIDEAALGSIMDRLDERGKPVAGNDFDIDTTGSLAAVTQKTAKQPGGASFDVAAGFRGDSTAFIATVDANNNVTLVNLGSEAAGVKTPANPGGSLGFGFLGEPGANYLNSRTIDLAPGEKAFVINVSDGVLDSYINNAAKGDGGFEALLRQDLETHLKANPESQNVARFLSERAVAQGSVDNTTAAAVRLDANTDLQGRSVLLAVFDGLGHGPEDGKLSSALSKALPAEVPGAEPAKPAARTEVAHIATRSEDLARAKNPAAVHPAEAKPAPQKPAAPKHGPDHHDGPGHGGGAAPHKTPQPQQHTAKPAPHPEHKTATPKPSTAAPHTTPHTAPHATGKPNIVSRVGGVHAHVGHHAGNAQGAATIALQLAQGDVKGAGVSAAMDLALRPSTYKAAAALTRKVAPVAKALGFFGKKVPVVGALVTVGFVAYEAGSHALKGEYGKAGAAVAAGGAEALGNIVGFGVGDLAREGVRETIIRTAGSKYAPEKSGLRQLGEGAIGLAQQALHHDNKPHPQAHAKPAAAPAKPAAPAAKPSTPSIYHYKSLPAVAYVLKDTPSQAINGKTVRTPDGHIKNLREINFADPKNMKALEDAIHRRLKKDEQLIAANTSIIPSGVSSFLGLRTNSRVAEDAKREASQLRNALRELQQFKREVHDHHGGPSAPAQSQFHTGQAKAATGGHTAPARAQPPKPQHPKPH
jgi:hypothetical protein